MFYRILSVLLFSSLPFFSTAKTSTPVKADYKNLMTAGAGVGSGFGFLGYDLGLRYEHFDRKIFPYISYTASLRRMECGDVGTWKENSWRTKTVTYYIAPGARVHLINKKAMVDFSFGINLPLGSMKRRDVYQGFGNNPTHTSDSTTAFFGAVVAELNLNIIHHGGFTFGINSSYGNVYSSPSTKLSRPNDGFFIFSLQLGYRW